MNALQTAAFLCLNLFATHPAQHEISWQEWCDSGCSVMAIGGTAYHCLDAHQHDAQPLLLQYPTNLSSTECLFHSASYNATQFANVSMRNNAMDADDVEEKYECSVDCLDWNTGCTQLLCASHNRTLFNKSQSVCSSSLVEPHCQTYAHEMDTYGTAVSLTLWFTVTDDTKHDGDGDPEIFLPVSMLPELQSIVFEYISRYTSYNTTVASSNISCSIYYPYQFTNFYAFYRDQSKMDQSNASRRLDIDQLLQDVIPSNNAEDDSAFLTTDVADIDIDADADHDLFTTGLLLDDTEAANTTQSTEPVESVSEFGANFYNYIPQCAVRFDALSTALQFMTDARNASHELSSDLFAVLRAYLSEHVSLLVHATHQEDNETSLYEYMDDAGSQLLYIESNDTLHHIRLWLPELTDDDDDQNDTNSSWSSLTAHDEFCVSLNRSSVKIQVHSLEFFLTDISLPFRTTAAPTSAPTKPSECWFDSTRIEHNSTWQKDACYSISCFDGILHIVDRYCDAQCYYLYNDSDAYGDTDAQSQSQSQSMFNESLCCAACSDNNDDCPSQLTCDSCLGSQRTCSWNGDHCSAICSGEYCWSFTADGECPAILVVRLQIKGVTLSEYDNARSRVNHALANTLSITENLIGDYFPTQTPDAYHIEVKKAISLTAADEQRIPKILMDDSYLARLNAEIGVAFQDVPSMRDRIVIASLEVELASSSPQIGEASKKWITDDASVVLLVCGTVICFTILALCVRYPILSFCCCCVPIAKRRKLRNWSRDYGCACCARFTFGVLYDDDRSQLVRRRRREQRMRNTQTPHDHDPLEAKQLEEENNDGDHGQAHGENELAPIEAGKKNKRRKKKKKAKKKKSKKKSKQDEVQTTGNMNMNSERLYYGHDVGVIQEEEIL